MIGIRTEEKNSIGGIKFMENLALFTITEPVSKTGTAMQFFSILSENEINISMISSIMDDRILRTDCSVSEDNLQRILELISPLPELEERLKVLRGLGSISIYPHKSSMNLLGIILFAFGKRKIPVYSMASSISAFTFLTECDCLDKAAKALKEYLMLPENHAPFQQQISIKHIHK